MSNTRSIAIVGVGGQGTVLTSDILIEGLVDLGFDVKKTEQHGLSQRGGSVNCMVKYGQAVYAPIIADGEADVGAVIGRDDVAHAVEQRFFAADGRQTGKVKHSGRISLLK